ncbi:hypothetical protein ABTN24_19435, partial [Acinetobacter baumannii]
MNLRAGSTTANPRYATQASTNTVLAGTEGTLITNGLSAFKGLRFDLDADGMIRANVNFELIKLPDWAWPASVWGSANISMSRGLSLY